MIGALLAVGNAANDLVNGVSAAWRCDDDNEVQTPDSALRARPGADAPITRHSLTDRLSKY